MKRISLLVVSSLLLGLPALAVSDDEARRKAAREKEVERAGVSAQNLAIDRRFEEKYAWAKEDFPDHYRKLVDKRREAQQAWQNAARCMQGAQDHDQLNACKIPAYQASALAHLAEMELKGQSAQRRWLSSAEKAGSEVARKASWALIENQKQTYEATRENYLRENQLRELSKQQAELEKLLDEEYEKATRREEATRRKPEPQRTREKKPVAKPEQPAPPKIQIE